MYIWFLEQVLNFHFWHKATSLPVPVYVLSVAKKFESLGNVFVILLHDDYDFGVSIHSFNLFPKNDASFPVSVKSLTAFLSVEERLVLTVQFFSLILFTPIVLPTIYTLFLVFLCVHVFFFGWGWYFEALSLLCILW